MLTCFRFLTMALCRNLGIDNVLLYVIREETSQETSFEQELESMDAVAPGFVTFIDFPVSVLTGHLALVHQACIKTFSNQTSWIAFVQTSEHIVTLPSLLSTKQPGQSAKPGFPLRSILGRPVLRYSPGQLLPEPLWQAEYCSAANCSTKENGCFKKKNVQTSKISYTKLFNFTL